MISEQSAYGDLEQYRRELHSRLSRKYRLCLEQITVGEQQLSIFTIDNIEEVLDALLEQPGMDVPEAPYWSELWPSSIALANVIFAHNGLTGKTGIELGCGLGLAGLAAHFSGADMVVSDNDPDALAIAELNWIKNTRSVPKTRLLDWRQPWSEPEYDLIIASDVAYQEDLLRPLANLLDAMLSATGVIYLSEPGRPVSFAFFELLRVRDFLLHKTKVSINYRNRHPEIDIYTITRK